MSEFKQHPTTNNDDFAVCERLEAILVELRNIGLQLKQMNARLDRPVQLSADDIHSLSRRR